MLETQLFSRVSCQGFTASYSKLRQTLVWNRAVHKGGGKQVSFPLPPGNLLPAGSEIECRWITE